MDFSFNVKNKRALLLFWFFLTGFSVQVYTGDHCSNCCPNDTWYLKIWRDPTIRGALISSVFMSLGWAGSYLFGDEQQKKANKELKLQKVELQNKEMELRNSDGWVKLENQNVSFSVILSSSAVNDITPCYYNITICNIEAPSVYLLNSVS